MSDSIAPYPARLALSRIVSQFVNEHYSGVYVTNYSHNTPEGRVFVTSLHSPDGPKVSTLVRSADGELVDVTR